MRAITSQTAAQALEITPKQLDNLLLRIGPGALGASEASRRQGRERRIPMRVLPVLALTLELMSELGFRVRDAYRLASQLLWRGETVHPDIASHEPFTAHRVGHLRISVDRDGLSRKIDQRLSAAIETTVRATRGRPRAQ